MREQAQPAGGDQTLANNWSVRQPSTTMSYVLVSQLQFLSTLSKVDHITAGDSMLSKFSVGLR